MGVHRFLAAPAPIRLPGIEVMTAPRSSWLTSPWRVGTRRTSWAKDRTLTASGVQAKRKRARFARPVGSQWRSWALCQAPGAL